MTTKPLQPCTAAAAKSLQSCPTLWDPIDGNPPGSPIPGILQGRTLEWVAISFSNAWKWKVKVKSLSHVWLFTTPWTAAYQAPPSMGFSRQEYWSGVPLPSPKYILHNWNTESMVVDCGTISDAHSFYIFPLNFLLNPRRIIHLLALGIMYPCTWYTLICSHNSKALAPSYSFFIKLPFLSVF